MIDTFRVQSCLNSKVLPAKILKICAFRSSKIVMLHDWVVSRIRLKHFISPTQQRIQRRVPIRFLLLAFMESKMHGQFLKHVDPKSHIQFEISLIFLGPHSYIDPEGGRGGAINILVFEVFFLSFSFISTSKYTGKRYLHLPNAQEFATNMQACLDECPGRN